VVQIVMICQQGAKGERAMGAYTDAAEAAKKVLGKEGELPKPKVDLIQIGEEWVKGHDSYAKTCKDLEKEIVDFSALCQKVKVAAKQYANLCDGDDFNLDAKNPDNKKKIVAATKIMLDGMGQITGDMDKNISRLEKLDRALTDLKRLDKVNI
jgi:hypothetical protein